MKISRETLENACWDAGLDPEQFLRANYSGRGMYGKTCVGLIHDTLDEVINFVYAVRQYDGGDSGLLEGGLQDSMGHSTITYWPRWSVEEES